MRHTPLTARAAGLMSKLHIINKGEPRLTFHSSFSPTATAPSACMQQSRGLGREEASPGVTLRLHRRDARIKVYKQRRTPKVALKPQHRRTERPRRRRCGARRSFPPGSPKCDRGAQGKKHAPQMFPLSPST